MSDDAVAVPRLDGRRVSLRPVFASDYDWLYSISMAPEVGFRWRLRGLTPSPDTFESILWSDVQVQMVSYARDGLTRLGLQQLYNVNVEDGIGYIGSMLDPEVFGKGWPHEGTALFLNYVFMTRNLRKLYFEASEVSLVNFQSGVGRFLEEEGVLRSHLYYDGSYHDVHILALYRERWDEISLKLGLTEAEA